MRYLVFLLMFVVIPAQAVVTLTGKTHAKNELVECADGTWWSQCLPGNEVVTNTAPVISLNGGNVTYTVGDTYSELGATCSDSEDGAIAVPAPSFSPALNMNSAGTYVATYTCTDTGSLTDTATRSVYVNSDSSVLSLAHLDNVSTSDQYYLNLKSFVDGATYNTTYGYRPSFAIYAYQISNDAAYLTRAIAETDSMVDAEIAAYPNPGVDNDSYLHINQWIEDVALTYAVGYDQLSQAQRTKWEGYANQVLFNVWNHNSAEFGGQSRTWSGWATDNPHNNYFYSFTEATVYWALASGNQTWIDHVNGYITPRIATALGELDGGGSREGFNYGMAHRRLGMALVMWANGAGIRMDAGTNFVNENLEYWVHSNTPDSIYAHPLGDMSRTGRSDLYDYMPQLLRNMIALEPASTEAEYARWQLDRYSFTGTSWRSKGFLFDAEGTTTAPTALQYHAEGVGDYFARSDWSTNANWLWLHNGESSESHQGDQQGDFAWYHNGWLTYNGNYDSNDGIQQDSGRFNVIRFERTGNPIGQSSSEAAKGTLVPTVNGSDVNVVMDISNQYSDSDVTSWVRTVDYNGSTVTIDDVTAHAGDITPIFQMTVPVAPTINGNTITAGSLQIVVNAPASPAIVSEDWSTLGGDSNTNHRISISGASNYNVTLSEI